MILTTPSTDRPVRSEPTLAASRSGPAIGSRLSDAISTGSAAFLRSELSRQPEIRPEVVARARALAADPNYPPMDALRKVAELILAAPDLTEDTA
jgi:hypothetical protein